MTVSPHFNHYNSVNEQSLIQDLVDETIYQRGVEVSYVRRTQDNIDMLFDEDTDQSYQSFEKIAMVPLFVEGFDGQELMTMFGTEFQKTGVFAVSKRKFEEIFPDLVRPREGDLIYFPVTNSILEIKFVEDESPFFEKGKQYIYQLKTQLFEYSHEEFSTGDTELDQEVLDSLGLVDPEVDVNDVYINDEVETKADEVIEFDPNNPFGVG